jgi:hypothetical protein
MTSLPGNMSPFNVFSPLKKGGILLFGTETQGIAFDFTYPNKNYQMKVLDTGTPANNFEGDPFTKLTYASPSIKLCRQKDGVWRYGNHNFCLQSQTIDNAIWSKNGCTVSANATAAPDGSTTADKVVESALSEFHYVQSQTISSTIIDQIYTVSVFVKAAGRTFGAMDFATHDGNNGSGIRYDLTNGTITGNYTYGTGNSYVSSSITDAGNGWYYITLSGTNPTTLSAILIYPSNLGVTTNYAGDGSSGIYVWGVQMKKTPVEDPLSVLGYLATTSSNVYALPYSWDSNLQPQGLLLERARTNLIANNQAFNAGSWTKTAVTISSNVTTAPDGTLTADKIIESAANTFHSDDTTGHTLTSASTYTVSCFAKAAERKEVELQHANSGFSAGVSVIANLINGSIVASSTYGTGSVLSSTSIQDAGNGWFRISVTGAVNGTSGGFTVAPSVLGTHSYQGDGSSGLYVWGAQVELGSELSSPIHTTTATVARAQDNVFVSSTTFPSVRATGSAYVEFYKPFKNQISIFPTVFQLSSGVHVNAFGMYGNDASNWNYDIWSGSALQADMDSGISTQSNGAIHKITTAWTTNDGAIVGNAGTPATDSSITVPVNANNLYIGVDAGGGNQLHGYLRKLELLPRRMTNGELSRTTNPSTTVPLYEQETSDFFARLTTQPSTARKSAYNNLIRSLKAYGIWNKLDILYVFAAADSTTALKNLKSSSFNATNTNSTTFAADLGYTGNQSNMALSCNWNPSTAGGNFSQNSACFFSYVTNNVQSFSFFGNDTFSVSNDSYCYVRNDADNTSFAAINGSAGGVGLSLGTNLDSQGFHSINRDSSITTTWYVNGASANTGTSPSIAVKNQNHSFMQLSAQFSDYRLSIAGVGGSLTAVEQAVLNNACRVYLEEIGLYAPELPEATAFYARITTPSRTRKLAYNALIYSLKNSGVWDRLDALYMFAAADQATALTNLKSSSYGATAISSPTFTADTGFTGNGTTNYLDSGFNPSTAVAPNFTQNSASMFAWSGTSASTNNYDMGSLTGQTLYIQARGLGGDTGHAKINATGTDALFEATIFAASGAYFLVGSRTGATAQAVYKDDGTTNGSDTSASVAVPNENIGILKTHSTFSNRLIYCAGIGGGLSSSNVSSLYSAVHTYLQTVAGLA